MPPRKKIELSNEVRDALEEDLRLAYDSYLRAAEDFKIKLYLINRAGLTIQDIADILEAGRSTVGDWKIEGEQARDRRRSEDPDGSRKRQAVS